jgi:hypothetical protein
MSCPYIVITGANDDCQRLVKLYAVRFRGKSNAMSQTYKSLQALAALLWVFGFGQYFCVAGTTANAGYSASSLQPQQGRYFRWATPPGWRVSETNAGVTLTSADGIYSASLAMILRSRGTRTPEAFLQWTFAHVPSYRDPRILAVTSLPSERMSYQVWEFIEAKVAYTDNGLPVTSVYKVGVANYAGMNDAMIVGYRAANAYFQEAQSFMPQIAKSIVLTNAAEASGNNTLVRPKNNPLDNSAVLEAGRNRQRTMDEAMRKDANARRGTVDLVDPASGEKLNVWTQNKNYYWRKPGSNEVVGTDTYNPPGVGYTPLNKN